MLTRHEAYRILEGGVDGLTRAFPNGECPHKIGSPMVLVVDDGGNNVPVATVIVKGLRPDKAERRRLDDRLAKLDGFSNGLAWFTQYREMYGPEFPKDVVRIQFNMHERLDRKEIKVREASEIVMQDSSAPMGDMPDVSDSKAKIKGLSKIKKGELKEEDSKK